MAAAKSTATEEESTDEQLEGRIIAAIAARGRLTSSYFAKELKISRRHLNRILTDLVEGHRLERTEDHAPFYFLPDSTPPGKPH